jgi:ribonuclease HI/exonuclease III
MKIISWNIRGLNSRSKQKMLRDLIIAESPDILLLQETKCTSEDMDRMIPYCWKRGGVVSLDATGTAGGLAILWNTNTVLLSNFCATKWSITAEYRLIGSNRPGQITCVYGPATPGDKHAFLHSLTQTPNINQRDRWIIGGDFNIIRTLKEKKGGTRRLERDTNGFNNLIEELSLVDLDYNNGMYTWSNRRTGVQQVSCKLDRFLTSEAFLMEGVAMTSTILDLSGSDHWPIQLWVDIQATPGKKPFRFEQFWLDHPDFQQNIQKWWEQAAIPNGSKMYKFQQKLKNLKQKLKSWNKHTFGNIFDSQKELKQQMEEIQRKIRDQGLTEALKEQEMKVSQHLETRKKQEEILWKQKSRIVWLKEGERNTSFFHRTAIQRRHSNKITQLTSEDGAIIQSHEDLEKTLIAHFQHRLTEPIQNRGEAIQKITRHVPAIITEEQNAALLRPISIEEVDQALEDTPKCKAPGPDGFTSDFFHHCWPIIRQEVWEILEDSRATGQVLQALNATFITLIPKEGNALRPDQYRPIALCNVVYKLLTKVIARRLKPLLPAIISPEQSGYVEGRQIMDSVILAHEVIHSLQKTKRAGMLLKLDLSKAFDNLSWEFMQAMLTAFGFDHKWVSWILNLTSSAFFSLLINGVPSAPFSPSRGLRQGDPLSPFLFIIMTEGLSRSIHAALDSNRLTGLPLHGISPPLSHSQFVDDTLLMGSPTVREALSIQSILSSFSEASGLECNKAKSLIFFFNTPPQIQRHISALLGFKRSSLPSKYLGIPLIDNALKNSSWDPLLSSFAKRLSSWTFRALNLPSRLVLLKAVLQALPVYAFSALAAPSFILTAIKRIQRNFLWQGIAKEKKIALVSWDKICKPKKNGGLGLRDPGIMNKILSAKIWWRWLKHPREIWAKLWRKKYTPGMPENRLIRWNGDDQGSLIWTAAKQNRQLITQHAFWEIGNGKTALFWTDSWQQWPALEQEEWATDISAQAKQAGLIKVADYWQIPNTEATWRPWRVDREQMNVNRHINLTPLHAELEKRKIPKNEGHDILRWGYGTQGTFNTKEAYHLKTLSQLLPASQIWQKIWSTKHWPKITLFLWLISHSSVLTWDNLQKRGFLGPSLCILCGKNEETLNHLLNSCPFTSQIWDQAACIMRTSDRNRDSIMDTISNWRDSAFQSPVLNRIWQLLPGFILWNTWKERNRRLFKNISAPWQRCWLLCRRNILETIHLQSWSGSNTPCPPPEAHILLAWDLSLPPTNPTLPPRPSAPSSPSFWSPPPEDFFKLNFDGASKGNPGAAGYGVVIRDSRSHILAIGAGSLGHTTNNVAELWGLIKGLQLALSHNYTKLFVEGDSQLIIGLLRRLTNGANPESISPSWRLSHGLQTVAGLINPNRVIIPSHIRRKANQVADDLANLGTTWEGPDFLCIAEDDPHNPILHRCIQKARTVDYPPDGVLVRATRQHAEGDDGSGDVGAREHLVPPPEA